jgi:hypothetical protein
MIIPSLLKRDAAGGYGQRRVHAVQLNNAVINCLHNN